MQVVSAVFGAVKGLVILNLGVVSNFQAGLHDASSQQLLRTNTREFCLLQKYFLAFLSQ